MNRLGKALLAGVGSAALVASLGVPAVAADGVARVSGANRYATAAAIQEKLLPNADVVFLVTGKDFPDALSAGPAAAKVNGAILLVDGDNLPAETVAAIKRIKPKAIYAIGGPSVVSEVAFKAAQALAPGAKAERIAGVDRYATSLAVAKRFFGDSPAKRYVASGTNFPDALAGGALAGKDKAPLILVPNDPGHVNVKFGAAGETIVLGGRSVVSDAVYQAAGASKRYAGSSRYATAKAILDGAYAGASEAIYASGNNFPDALAAVPVAALKGIPLFLAGKTFTPVTITLKGWVVGGTAAVADGAWAKSAPASTPTPSKTPGSKPGSSSGSAGSAGSGSSGAGSGSGGSGSVDSSSGSGSTGSSSGGSESPNPGSSSGSDSGTSGTSEPSSTTMAAKLKQAAKQYAEVLDNIDKYKFEGSWGNDGEIKYTYSLGDINGDKIPDLSVDKQYSGNEGSLSSTRFFSSGGTNKPVVAPEKSLQGGTASGGGFRGGVKFTKDGNGVVEWYFYSGSGEGESTLYRLQDNQLVEAQKQSFSMGDQSSTSLNIETYDAKPISVNNRAYLYFLEHGQLDTLATEQAKDETAPEPTIPESGNTDTNQPRKVTEAELGTILSEAKKQGNQAFIGTVRIMTHDEVLAFQGIKEPNPHPFTEQHKGNFALLAFDKEMPVTAQSTDPMNPKEKFTQSVSCISLGTDEWGGNISRWQALNGKRVVMVLNPSEAGYPTDASLPLGAPRGGNGHIIAVAE